jgi:hypothetical protein
VHHTTPPHIRLQTALFLWPASHRVSIISMLAGPRCYAWLTSLDSTHPPPPVDAWTIISSLSMASITPCKHHLYASWSSLLCLADKPRFCSSSSSCWCMNDNFLSGIYDFYVFL